MLPIDIRDIGNFENYKLRFSLNFDSSNDFFNPTDGTINKIDISLSPNDISDDSYYKISVANKNYRQLEKSNNQNHTNSPKSEDKIKDLIDMIDIHLTSY